MGESVRVERQHKHKGKYNEDKHDTSDYDGWVVYSRMHNTGYPVKIDKSPKN